jgi:predicted GIY-YIG superfamily endonuclease
VYTLLLKQNKFYVGYTARPVDRRFIEHFNNSGSKWTIKYPPVQVLNIVPAVKKDENRITLETMDKYGWWNVRGGSWCSIEMESCPKALLDLKGIRLPKYKENGYCSCCKVDCFDKKMNN